MVDRLTINIEPRPPFAFDLTAAYHNNFQAQHRAGDLPSGPLDGPVDETYRRLLDLGDRLGLATVRSTGSVDAPRLELELRGEGITAEHGARAARQVSWLLGTDQDLGPFYALAGNDPVLERVVDRFYGLHLPHTATIFEALVLGVVGQQIATNVARIIRTLIIETYGPRAEFDGATYYCFPRPEAIRESSPDELRAMKLTRRKSEYIHGIAGAALDPAVGLEDMAGLSDAEAVGRLTALRGIGQWTAQWVLIRGLDRPDALPLGDLALRRVVSRLFLGGREVTDAEVEELARPWSPWRSYATCYLFNVLRTGLD